VTVTAVVELLVVLQGDGSGRRSSGRETVPEEIAGERI